MHRPRQYRRSRNQIVNVAAAFAVMLSVSETAAQTIDHAQEYEACLTLVSRAPQEALPSAEAWAARGGAAAAGHCAALALIELGRPIEAANRLEALAVRVPFEGTPSPMDLMAQAAQAWLLAGDQARALQAIDAALQGEPDAADLLIDRAQILGDTGNYAAALTDLDRAVALAPEDADAAAFRTSALRHLDRLVEALSEAERAMTLNPDNPSARLERGIIRQLSGDTKAAVSDLRQVVDDHPGTPAAGVAAALLQRLPAAN